MKETYEELLAEMHKNYRIQLTEENKRFLNTLKGYKNDSPSYVIGIDPFNTPSRGSLAGVQPSKTEEKMKTKKFYHTFKLGERVVTLCLLVTEKPKTFEQVISGQPKGASLKVGYSVCHPDDEFNEELSKKISLGRAEKEKSRLDELSYTMPSELAFDLGILKGFALRGERLIAQGHIVIKGIQSAEERKEVGRETTQL